MSEYLYSQLSETFDVWWDRQR